MSGDARAVLGSFAVLACTLIAGALLVTFADATWNVSRLIFVTVDIQGFAVIILTAFLMMVICLPMPLRQAERLAELRLDRIPLWLIAGLTFVATALGTHLVYDAYAFSMDEWMTRLQGEVFLTGEISGQVPEEWRPYGRAMYHSFAAYDPVSGRVASDYRPGMALLWAGFQTLGLGVYASAVLNALAVVMVAAVARQIWPADKTAPIMAALLLALSQQALAAAMTSYAMTAHLFFNLLWLSLFLRDEWRFHILAALVGVLTAALHQIHFHMFFAVPFLFTLLRPFRPRLILFYFFAYLVGHLAIFGWDWLSINRHAIATSPEATRSLLERIGRLANWPSPQDLGTVFANLSRLFAWQSLALVPLLIAGLIAAARQRWPLLVVVSVLTSLLPYPFLMPDQGHGWGYRYLHGLLGNLALLGAFGWSVLLVRKDRARLRCYVILMLLVAPVAILPFRAVQIGNTVKPYAEASRLTAETEADVVIVDSTGVYIGQDIPRNSAIHPGRPIQLHDQGLTPEQIAQLCRKYRVVFIPASRFAELGLQVAFPDGPPFPEAYARRLEALADPTCAQEG